MQLSRLFWSVLPFLSKSFSGSSVLLQGIELGTVRVPLHQIELSSEVVSGPVIVGLRSSLPVKGIDLVLGNDLAGGKVEANPCVSDTPNSHASDFVEVIPGLFPVCAVTRAMARRALDQVSDEQSVVDATVQPIEVPLSVPPSVSLESEPEICCEPTQQTNGLEATKNSVLSAHILVREQQNDPGLQKLREQAISEVEASKVPGCYYLKNDVLMRKWRPRKVSASNEWRVVHQVVIPPLYRLTY